MNLRRAAILSLIDQIVLSAVHFAAGLAVLRAGTKESYGTYVVGSALVLLLCGLQNAFINTQMTLRGAGRPIEERRALHSAFLTAQYLLYTPLALLMLGGSVIAATCKPELRGLATSAAAITLAFAGVGLREFVRTSLFMAPNIKRVLLLDLLYATVLALLTAVAIRYLSHSPLLPIVAILSLGCASLLSASCFARPLLARRPSHPIQAGHAVLLDSFKDGLWAAGGVAVTHLQAQAHVYVLSLFAGVAVTAEANAGRLLLTPISLAMSSLQRVLYPHWVGLVRSTNHTALTKLARAVFAIITLGIAGYALLLILPSDWLIDRLLGSEYRASGAYVALFAGLAWSEGVRTIISVQLQAHSRFKEITLANATTVIPVLIAAAVTVRFLGPQMVIWTQIAGDLLLALIMWRILINLRPAGASTGLACARAGDASP